VYTFLDPAEQSRAVVAGYIIGILVGCLIVFFIVHFVIKFRRWLTEDKLHKTGKFSLNTRDRSGDVERAEFRHEK
jgi:hypothetical protein